MENFERTGALQLLIFLYKWKESTPARLTDLYHSIKGHHETVRNAVGFLVSLGYVAEEVEKKLPYTHTVWLTALGEQLAKCLVEAEQVVLQPQPRRE